MVLSFPHSKGQGHDCKTLARADIRLMVNHNFWGMLYLNTTNYRPATKHREVQVVTLPGDDSGNSGLTADKKKREDSSSQV